MRKRERERERERMLSRRANSIIPENTRKKTADKCAFEGKLKEKQIFDAVKERFTLLHRDCFFPSFFPMFMSQVKQFEKFD